MSAGSDSRVIWDSDDISRALNRIALHILESNKGSDGLLLLGIRTRGVPLAHRLGAAIEAADVVLMDDDPLKIAVAQRIARKTMRIVYENIVFSIGVKAVVLVLGAIGLALKAGGHGTGEVNAEGATQASWAVEAFEQLDIPVLQAITSSMTQAQWEASERGLNPLDTAMNVALPEFDDIPDRGREKVLEAIQGLWIEEAD